MSEEARDWKMCHIAFQYFSVYKIDVMHSKLAILLMLRSICIQGKNQLHNSSTSQSCVDLWRTDCSSMHQIRTLCKGCRPKQENQHAVCPVYNPCFSGRSVRETLSNPIFLTLSHQRNRENKRINVSDPLCDYRLYNEMEKSCLPRSLRIGCKGNRNWIKGKKLSS